MKEFEECYENWAHLLADLDQQYGVNTCEQETSVKDRFKKPHPLTGKKFNQKQYSKALNELIAKLHNLVTVYPLARMYDCNQLDGDTPPFSLNNTSLGTF